MRVLFFTQSSSLGTFFDLFREMRKDDTFEGAGFYLSDSAFYRRYRDAEPELESGEFPLLKEWDVIEKSRARLRKGERADVSRLREYERRFGDPFLWNALMADRRVYLGERASFEQDYAARYDHEAALMYLQTAVEEIEALFDRVQPQLVVTYICVTIGDYLANLIAHERGVKFLNLRPTRVRNYFFAGESVHEPSPWLEAEFRRLLADGLSTEQRADIENYLGELRNTHAMYEGVIAVPERKNALVVLFGRGLTLAGSVLRFFGRFVTVLREAYIYNYGEFRHDTAYAGVFPSSWFQLVTRPLRNLSTERRLRRHYLDGRGLRKLNESGHGYAFYPLHKEPEVTLLVYSRPFVNQIEVIRNAARSLPAGMKLIVKEHPASMGYRRLDYYRKILAIPGVELAAPELKSRELVQGAELIFVISGSVGLESLMLKKPVIHFGNAPFSILPASMISRCTDLFELAHLVRRTLDEHRHDEEAMIAYVAAVQNLSLSVDWYTRLLGRGEGFRFDKKQESRAEAEAVRLKQIRQLGEYLLGRAGSKVSV